MAEVDLYLKSLEERGKDISRREDSLTKKEEAVSALRAQLIAERTAWESAFSHYREFLQAQEKQIPLSSFDDLRKTQGTTDFTNVNLRVGEKRKAVLLFIAKQSEAGRRLTTREIMEGTGLDAGLISNVVWADRNRGFLDRVGDRIVMTPKGFEFIGKAGVYSNVGQTGVYSIVGQSTVLSVDKKN